MSYDIDWSKEWSWRGGDGGILEEVDPKVSDWAKQPNKPTYTKAEIGLGNVDNTSDANKPISTATKTYVDTKVDKSAIDYTGITSQVYEPMFGGEFTVTTVTEEGQLSPHALATVTGRISKSYTYRVTVNGTQYILPCDLDTYSYIRGGAAGIKCYEYLGNLALYVSDASRLAHDLRDVPFMIISDLDGKNSIDIYTETAGTYTILVEKIVISGEKLPNYLIYGDGYTPIELKKNSNSTYSGISIGLNSLTNQYGTAAIGYANTCSNKFSQAFGVACTSSGMYSHAEGFMTTASNQQAHAEGLQSKASGPISHAEGVQTVASGNLSHAEGIQSKSSGHYSHAEGYMAESSGSYSHSEGRMTTASGDSSHSGGSKSIASGKSSFAHGNLVKTTDPSQFAVGYGNDPQTDSIFEVGNGVDANGQPTNTGDTEPATRQNAFRVTQSGVAVAQTGLQIGDTSISETQLKGLISLNVTLTQEEYDALTDEQKNNGSYYFIVEE